MRQHTDMFPMAGIWYSPDTPGTQVRGTLEREDSGQTILTLFCLSEDEYEIFKDVHTIQGMNSSGRMVTLLDCFVAGWSKSARSDSPGMFVDKDTKFIWNVNIFINYTLVGVLVPSIESKSFKSICMRSIIINDWCHAQYYKYEKNTENIEPWAIIYDDKFCKGTLLIRIIAAQSKSHGLYTELKETDLRIELTKENKMDISVRQAIDIGYPVLELLCFLCDQDHGCNMFELEHGEYEFAQLYWNDNFSTNKRRPHVGDILSLNDISKHFSAMLTSWYDNHSKYSRMASLFRHTLSDSVRHEQELITAYVRILEIMLDREEYTITEKDDKRVKEAIDILKTIENTEIKNSYLISMKYGKDKGNAEYFISYLKNHCCPVKVRGKSL